MFCKSLDGFVSSEYFHIMELKQSILVGATRLAAAKGLRALTRLEVAHGCKCAESTVSHHYATMAALREAVVVHAVDRKLITVLARAWAEGHPAIRGKLTAALKERVAARIIRR